jgi:putative acetyltransferase
MPGCVVRAAVATDAPAILAVHMAAIQGLGASHYSQAQLSAWRGNRSAASYAAPIAKGAIVVAIESNAIVGFGQLSVAEATVEAVYVLPARARTGLGQQLLSTLEQRARAGGLSQLSLDASLNAEAFYAACGYVPVSRAEHELRPGVHLPCVHMVKALAAARDA